MIDVNQNVLFILQLNNLPSFFKQIPDEIFREAVNSRRELVRVQNTHSIEMQAVRVTNQMEKENEFTEKNSTHQLICDVLSSNLELLPEVASIAEIESKFKSFKKHLKTVGRGSTKLSNNLGIRQYQMGLILFISNNIKKFKPALWDFKNFEVKSSVNPKEKCILSVAKFVSLDILTLIENENDEV